MTQPRRKRSKRHYPGGMALAGRVWGGGTLDEFSICGQHADLRITLTDLYVAYR